MDVIELERWERKPDDPRYMQYAGPVTGEEVFEELKQRLQDQGMLPDEYFLMDSYWEKGREIPRGAEIFCSTDYGSNEGIYIDVEMKWHESGKPVFQNLATGKTLGDSSADLDRMFLTSSAITKAFHGGRDRPEQDMILNLTPAERRLLVDTLVKQREEMQENTAPVENLLRRVTGSITAYMEEVGERPIQLSDFDRAMLAIHDCEEKTFVNLIPKLPEHRNDLLLTVSARAGTVGRRMTEALLESGQTFSNDVYLAASKAAVDIADKQRVFMMADRAEKCVNELAPSYYGDLANYAYRKKPAIGQELIRRASPEQIQSATPLLLQGTASARDFRSSLTLVEKGAHAEPYSADILRTLFFGHDEWLAERLLQSGMEVSMENFSALGTCLDNHSTACAKLLLDRGMDFDRYLEWEQAKGVAYGDKDTRIEAEDHWRALQAQTEQVSRTAPEPPAMQMGGLA